MKLSIVIPIFNEVSTVEQIIEKVCSVSLPVERELALMDDYSTDGTRSGVFSSIALSIKALSVGGAGESDLQASLDRDHSE